MRFCPAEPDEGKGNRVADTPSLSFLFDIFGFL